jgi:hypothetical protein
VGDITLSLDEWILRVGDFKGEEELEVRFGLRMGCFVEDLVDCSTWNNCFQ